MRYKQNVPNPVANLACGDKHLARSDSYQGTCWLIQRNAGPITGR